jgi:glycosyltransferase involved in cell wall biosynthesis
MKVLHVASWYPRSAGDIAGIFVREHVRALRNQVEQLVCVPGLDGDDRRVREHDLWVERPRLAPARGRWLMPYIAAVWQIARAFRPDLLHAHVARPAGVAARAVANALGVPYVVTEHTGPFQALFETHLLNRAAAAWALRGAAAITSPSNRHAADMRVRFPDLHPVVVANTVDLQRFRLRERADGPARLLFIGRLFDIKRCDRLLSALARPELAGQAWRLEIAGDGPEAARLRAQAEALELAGRVRFLGHVPPAELPEVLARADALVLPSVKESFGVVVIEALASGLPILATRCGGPEATVTNAVGRLIPVDDSDALADGLGWLIARHREFDPRALRSYAESRFGYPAIAAQFLALYENGHQLREAA